MTGAELTTILLTVLAAICLALAFSPPVRGDKL